MIGTYTSATKTEGVRVENTKQLTPGAREPYATGTNKVGERFKTKHKPFGKLGAKGFAE